MTSVSPTVEELRQYFIEGRERLLHCDPMSLTGRAWIEQYTGLMDETLRRIYHAACVAARGEDDAVTHHDCDQGVALLAIGGYGRGELCPHSDIDIAFVPLEEENPTIDAVIKEAFRLIVEVLIDGARLDVAYAYRPIADCERLDHAGKTALLSARCIAGNEGLLHRMRSEIYRTWDTVGFLLDKAHERRNMAKQIDYSLYAVEPNLKDGAGALRDIQTALWAADSTLRTGEPMRELEWRGVITAEDAARATAAADFFLQLRVWLHLTTGKKNDVMRVDWQDRCARAFHYTGVGAQAAQSLLGDYYRYAEEATAFFNKVMDRLLEGPLPLDSHFIATQGRLNAAHPYTLRNHPELIMAPFALARKYGFTIEPELLRAVEDTLPLVSGETRRHPISRAGFLALISNIGAAADALTELRARGVLQRYIPEFEAMLHLAPADPSHQLTVGEHSINAVRQLGALWKRRPDDGEMHSVWEGVDDIEVLVLGTLLHDVGKIEPGTEHSESGEQIARRIAARLDLGSERTERLAMLVRRHLLLPRVARLRDLAAPGTLREVMEHVHDVPMLKKLYLLSLADTRAVGERTYSNLDLQAMKELYQRTLIVMTGEQAAEVMSDTERREMVVQRERERLRREMRHLELDDATLQRLSDTLPAPYVLNTPLPTIATHLRLLDQLPQEQLIVDFIEDPRGGFTEMTVIAYDDETPGLLSKICGVVHAVGAEILAAQVHTLRAGSVDSDGEESAPAAPEQRDIVLDRLHLAAGRGATSAARALSESRCSRLAAQLREVILGTQSVENVLVTSQKEIPTGVVPQRISARNDLSDEHTVISIVSDNVSGLLYHVTHALAHIGLDIHTAKVTTWGGRAEDAFYVTRRNPDGRDEKLEDDSIRTTLEALGEQLKKPAWP